MALNASSLIKGRAPVEVRVESLGDSAYIRVIQLGERAAILDKMNAAFSGSELEKVAAWNEARTRCLCLSLVDENSERLFRKDAELAELPADVADVLLEAAWRINAMPGSEAVDEAEKK